MSFLVHISSSVWTNMKALSEIYTQLPCYLFFGGCKAFINTEWWSRNPVPSPLISPPPEEVIWLAWSHLFRSQPSSTIHHRVSPHPSVSYAVTHTFRMHTNSYRMLYPVTCPVLSHGPRTTDSKGDWVREDVHGAEIERMRRKKESEKEKERPCLKSSPVINRMWWALAIPLICLPWFNSISCVPRGWKLGTNQPHKQEHARIANSETHCK